MATLIKVIFGDIVLMLPVATDGTLPVIAIGVCFPNQQVTDTATFGMSVFIAFYFAFDKLMSVLFVAADGALLGFIISVVFIDPQVADGAIAPMVAFIMEDARNIMWMACVSAYALAFRIECVKSLDRVAALCAGSPMAVGIKFICAHARTPHRHAGRLWRTNSAAGLPKG